MTLNRITETFSSLKKQNRSALITFHMAFDPDMDTSYQILKKLPKLGVNIIELGMPFSDPIADGKTIQEASKRALKAGANIKNILKMAKSFREENKNTPLVLMGYYNPILSYGTKKFMEDSYKAGIDSFIIVDLPLEEKGNIEKYASENNISLIRIITPDTSEERLKKISEKASGFVYYVSVASVTGTKSANEKSIEEGIKKARKHFNIPIVVGFGIKTSEAAAKIAKFADGVVVGSALINLIEKETLGEEKHSNIVNDFVKSLSKAMIK